MKHLRCHTQQQSQNKVSQVNGGNYKRTKYDKLMELVCGGYIINGASLSSFKRHHHCQLDPYTTAREGIPPKAAQRWALPKKMLDAKKIYFVLKKIKNNNNNKANVGYI